jgi:hypothetical protein
LGTVSDRNEVQLARGPALVLLAGAWIALGGAIGTAATAGAAATTTAASVSITAPTDVTAEPDNGQATVSWVNPPLAGQVVENFVIKVLPSTGGEGWSDEATRLDTQQNGSRTTYVVPNLTNGTLYTFYVQVKVKVSNTSLLGAPSAWTSAVTPDVVAPRTNSTTTTAPSKLKTHAAATPKNHAASPNPPRGSSDWGVIALAVLAVVAGAGAVLYFRKSRRRFGAAASWPGRPRGVGHLSSERPGFGWGSTNGAAPIAAPLIDVGRTYTATPPPMALSPAAQDDIVFMKAEPAPDFLTSGCRRVMPQFADSGVFWATGDRSMFAAGLWSEKKLGKGEDAEPAFILQPAARRLLVGVFDGMGGSGGAVSRQTLNGPVTQAYEASRLARDATESWFRAQSAGLLDPATSAAQLQGELSARLQAYSSTLPQVSSQLVGTMKRTLPTTLAAVVAELGEVDTRVTALWAGDSRCYILTPDHGLQQISRDDTRIQDALEALLADPPLENVVCADRGFTVGHATVTVSQPAIVMVATDGCFGYVPTPPIFEAHILSTLTSSPDGGNWMPSLLGLLEHLAQDDTSLAIAAVGFPDFPSLQAAFRPRADFIRLSFGDPVAAHGAASGEGRGDFEEFRKAAWTAYKQGYEARLPARPVRI